MTEPMSRKRFLELPMDARREILRLEARLLQAEEEKTKGLAEAESKYEELKEEHFQLDIEHNELARDYDANLIDLKACITARGEAESNV